jgi:5-methyltetrahydrofolate--homocysteine methyltransferase
MTIERNRFRQYWHDTIMILDGAFGTEMQKRGMPAGISPEQWVIEHPEVLLSLQREYVRAGSHVLYTATFGANRLKLEEYGLAGKTLPLNREIARLAREAAGPDTLVAGDISATGSFIHPLGDLAFETAVDIYKEQVLGLLEGGVDFFVIETMIDIQEARAALLAVRESCDLPVCVSMTYGEDMRTLTGTDPVSALITLQSLGADAVGCNCSTGPETMLQIIKALKPYAKVPLLAKPNAGLPKLVDGRTHFDMSPEDFGKFIPPLLAAGVNLIGGCCGTSPAYIREISRSIAGFKPAAPEPRAYTAVTSIRKTVFIGPGFPVAVVGERINPTGKKQLQSELLQGKTTEVRRMALEQVEHGAVILDVNVGMPGIDEQATMRNLIELLAATVEAPLSIDSATPEVIEAALRIYPGRALVNSLSAEQVKLERLLPIIAKYGAVFIALPLNDAGIPTTAAERFEIIQTIYAKAAQRGYTKPDMVVDGLVMTVSADQKAALETLKVVDWCTTVFGVNTILGLSNVSFGLPERSLINSAFLAMAIGKGLTMAIANPATELLMNLKYASDVLVSKDIHSSNYLARFGNTCKTGPTGPTPEMQRGLPELISEAIIGGDKEGITGLLNQALALGFKAAELVNHNLIPAINRVGELFESKQYFLPQLIQSAETMKKAFELLEPRLAEENPDRPSRSKARVVLATVKGDIHDIGKNLVALMMKNHGFEIYDLGKDVSAAAIIAKAAEVGADLIGLSALMTTTMVRMKEVVALARESGLKARIIVGGAVVNEAYAREIGADGYSPDAYRAVKLAENLLAV